jgi:hypothetical protein
MQSVKSELRSGCENLNDLEQISSKHERGIEELTTDDEMNGIIIECGTATSARCGAAER